MSKSRLEKFLYAIYTLDYSDLPKPLSRIEELYNCWATGGEVPTFTPLSRVEKYLMAILGNYDISELPEPLSRVEVLLHKLVMGDDNLEEIKSFLSRHEELLAGIIRNGGFSGSDDFYHTVTSLAYAHNTLYYTAEEPVKSAILKGNTLVNEITLVETVDKKAMYKANYALKSGSVYTLILPNIGSNKKISVDFFNYSTETYKRFFYTTSRKTVFTAQEDEFLKNIVATDGASVNDCLNAILLEGDYTNIDVPYFEGMKSVQMPVLKTQGKNLFDLELTQGGHSYGEAGTKPVHNQSNNRVTNLTGTYIKVNPNTKITFSILNNIDFAIAELDINGYSLGDTGWVGYTTIKPNHTITTKEKTSYIGFNFRKFDNSNITVQEVLDSNPMLEISGTATPYEPFKSNILTVNEDVELRGVGDVQDELNLLTGEVTECIGEYIITGDENWTTNTEDNNQRFSFYDKKNMPIISGDGYDSFKTFITCDRFNGVYWSNSWNTVNTITTNNSSVYIQLPLGTTIEQAKTLMVGAKIQYVLAQPTIKTVDLSVVDQDGNDTKLKTFEDITHVILSSGGLIPTGEMEVAMQIQHVIYNLANSLNTLYNTLDRSPKNAILKGQTENICDRFEQGSYSFSSSLGTVTATPPTNDRLRIKQPITGVNGIVRIAVNDDYEMLTAVRDKDGNVASTNWLTVTTKNLVETDKFYFSMRKKDGSDITPNDLYTAIISVTGYDLFEMKSVQMSVLKTQGKNLFNPDMLILGGNNYGIAQYSPDTSNLTRALLKQNNLIEVKPNSTLTLSCDSRFKLVIQEYDENEISTMRYDSGWQTNGYHSLTVSANTKKVNLYFVKQDPYTLADITSEEFEVLKNSIQLEENSTVTPYEPFKSNILTVSEDVELRGIGEVQDELDLVTGELTERVGEYVFDGSEKFLIEEFVDNNEIIYAKLISHHETVFGIGDIVCNNFIGYKTSIYGKPLEGVYFVDGIKFMIKKNKLSEITSSGVAKFLSDTGTIIQYKKPTESVKTVDLSVVDQDGNDTKLKTFEDITHVILSSGGLIPTGEMEVATKNLGDINNTVAMSLRMNDISSTQETLEEVSDAQSESIDATMMATTEVYEQIL